MREKGLLLVLVVLVCSAHGRSRLLEHNYQLEEDDDFDADDVRRKTVSSQTSSSSSSAMGSSARAGMWGGEDESYGAMTFGAIVGGAAGAVAPGVFNSVIDQATGRGPKQEVGEQQEVIAQHQEQVQPQRVQPRDDRYGDDRYGDDRYGDDRYDDDRYDDRTEFVPLSDVQHESEVRGIERVPKKSQQQRGQVPQHMGNQGPKHISNQGPKHMGSQGPKHMGSQGPKHMGSQGPKHMRNRRDQDEGDGKKRVQFSEVVEVRHGSGGRSRQQTQQNPRGDKDYRIITLKKESFFDKLPSDSIVTDRQLMKILKLDSLEKAQEILNIADVDDPEDIWAAVAGAYDVVYIYPATGDIITPKNLDEFGQWLDAGGDGEFIPGMISNSRMSKKGTKSTFRNRGSNENSDSEDVDDGDSMRKSTSHRRKNQGQYETMDAPQLYSSPQQRSRPRLDSDLPVQSRQVRMQQQVPIQQQVLRPPIQQQDLRPPIQQQVLRPPMHRPPVQQLRRPPVQQLRRPPMRQVRPPVQQMYRPVPMQQTRSQASNYPGPSRGQVTTIPQPQVVAQTQTKAQKVSPTKGAIKASQPGVNLLATPKHPLSNARDPKACTNC